MNEPKNVTLRVIEQGAVRVNAAHLHRDAQGIVCIYVDLHSKYVETPMVSGGDNEPPALCFTAGEDALHLDDSKPRDSLTIVEFPEYVGWHVFACYGPARYTLSVVLVAASPETAERVRRVKAEKAQADVQVLVLTAVHHAVEACASATGQHRVIAYCVNKTQLANEVMEAAELRA